MTFDQLFAQLINIEQGYSNNASDSGGETNHGITVAVARAYGYTGAIRAMPKEVARAIYLERYWKQPRFDQVAQISAAVAHELFDTGVNMGQAVAGKFLQRALNLLNRRASLFPDIAADGLIGSMTIAALKAFLRSRGADGEKVILRMLNAQQSVRYMEIAERREKDEDFMFGWNLNRVEM